MMKTLVKSIVLVILIALPAGKIYAESIFLKDGSIIEGRIIKDIVKSSTILIPGGKTIEVLKKDILRVTFDTEYKNKNYLYDMNGDVIECFIVNEDRGSYTYRTDLASTKESVIKKSQVNLISRQKLAGIREKPPLVKPILFDRFMNFKLGYTSIISYSTANPAAYVPGFEIGYGFYDKIVEYEMSLSIGFGNADTDMFSRMNVNFVFGNIFGFGLGFYTNSCRHEINLYQPYIEFTTRGIFLGPVLRIPNVLHLSLFIFMPTGSDVNYKTSKNGNTFYYESPFNFNFLFSADIFIWKSLSIGLSYVLTGGEYTYKNLGGSQSPQYGKILYYNHQIVLSAGLGFNL